MAATAKGYNIFDPALLKKASDADIQVDITAPCPLLIDIHLLHNHNIIVRRQLLHRHILANLLLRDDLLVQYRRRAPLEFIAPLLVLPLIRLDIIPHQRRLLRRNHTDIHIRP